MMYARHAAVCKVHLAQGKFAKTLHKSIAKAQMLELNNLTFSDEVPKKGVPNKEVNKLF